MEIEHEIRIFSGGRRARETETLAPPVSGDKDIEIPGSGSPTIPHKHEDIVVVDTAKLTEAIAAGHEAADVVAVGLQELEVTPGVKRYSREKESLASDFELRKKFRERVKEDLKQRSSDSDISDMSQDSDCGADVDQKPPSWDAEALWEALRKAGMPAPKRPSKKWHTLGPLSRLNVEEFRRRHQKMCTRCKGMEKNSLHTGCYGKELCDALEFGFPLPVRHLEAKPIKARHWKPESKEDQALLDDRTKEIKWEARIPLKNTPLSEEEVWVASAFVARKRIFQEADKREPRLVVGFHETANTVVEAPPFSLVTASDILREIRRGDKMGLIDLSSAYLQIPISPDYWKYLGVYNQDGSVGLYRKLPFGLSAAPIIFSVVMAEVINFCRDEGLRASNFFDDCPQAVKGTTAASEFDQLCRLFDSLGLVYKPEKVQRPSTKFTLLGLDVDLEEQSMAAKQKSLEALHMVLREARNRALTISEVRSLIGRLNFLANIIPEGRLHLRGLYTALGLLRSIAERGKRCKGTRGRILRIWGPNSPRTTRTDLEWWWGHLNAILRQLQKRAHHDDTQELALKCPLFHLAAPVERIHSDASLEFSAAAFHRDAVFLVHKDCPGWHPFFTNSCDAELLGACLPIIADPKRFKHSLVICDIDNAGAAFILDSMRPTRPHCIRLLTLIAKLQHRYQFRVYARWIPRDYNSMADALSRLKNLGKDQLNSVGLQPIKHKRKSLRLPRYEVEKHPNA